MWSVVSKIVYGDQVLKNFTQNTNSVPLIINISQHSVCAVSYTHLDVYKRQATV